jgi:arylsulfatase A-like enzyme
MRRLFLLLATAVTLNAADAPPPNIVFIMLDNVGQEWFGCYGSEEGCTPQIDRLADTGMRAEHCYTPSVCGPSRTVLLTGRYPHSTGFRLHHDAALYSGGGLDPKREILFPRLFREAGYATCIAGKWQVNNLYDEPDVLTAHGFDEQLVWPGSLDTNKVKGADLAKYWDAVKREDAPETTAYIQNIESRYWDPVFLRNGKREEHPGKFGPDVTQEFAFDFLKRHREKPFMLYYPMVLTHGATFTVPVVPTPDHPEKGLSHEEMFANMLRYADKLVGQFVEELDKLGLRENTIVFVASDNGTEKSFHARRNGREVTGGLYTLTEAGSDVVLLANSPKLVPAGRVLPLADFTDLYPTFCELAEVPLSPKHKPDGKSFAQFLLGRSTRRRATGFSTSTTRTASCATRGSSSTATAASSMRTPIPPSSTTRRERRQQSPRRTRTTAARARFAPTRCRAALPAAQPIRLQTAHGSACESGGWKMMEP